MKSKTFIKFIIDDGRIFILNHSILQMASTSGDISMAGPNGCRGSGTGRLSGNVSFNF